MPLSRWFHRYTAPDNRFGFAVCGTGHGAEKMCEALRSSGTVRVSAIVSSSVEKAQRFGRRFGVERAYSYEDFAALTEDRIVDAVYLALPVSLHRRFTELAAAAGKHVLSEKPMAANVADAQAMIAACATAQRLLMIAYRLDYDPMHEEAKRLLHAGVLGEIQHVRSAFGIVAKTGWRFDPALAGGGSLFDVGVYPIHALHQFFGECKISHAKIEQDAVTSMELDAVWSGVLTSGATFECRSSYRERVPDCLEITGTRGTLKLEHAFAYERTHLRAEYLDADGKRLKTHLHDRRSNPSLFRLEAEHLAHCALTGTSLRTPGESGLRDLETVAQIEAIAERSAAQLRAS